MNETELHNKSVAWLELQDRRFKLRPQRFRPKEVADAVGGAYGILGRIANKVVSELNARGISIRYVRTKSSVYFELL
jgi:hypothetical protein